MTWEEFDKSLTPEELATKSWLDLPDERLGQMIRANVSKIESASEEDEFRHIFNQTAALVLIAAVQKRGRIFFELTADSTVTSTGEKEKWVVSINQVV